MTEVVGTAPRKPECSVWISPLFSQLRHGPPIEGFAGEQARGAEEPFTPSPTVQRENLAPDCSLEGEPNALLNGPFERVKLRRDGARPLVFDGALLFDMLFEGMCHSDQADDGTKGANSTSRRPDVRIRAFVLTNGEIAAAASIECDRSTSRMPIHSAILVPNGSVFEHEMRRLLDNDLKGAIDLSGSHTAPPEDTLTRLQLGLLSRAGFSAPPLPAGAQI